MDCMICGQPTEGNGFCGECEAGVREMMADLGLYAEDEEEE